MTVELAVHAVAEPQPGARWQARFVDTWPAYRAWYLRHGDAARPSYALARRMLSTHMPELVPTWERMVELAGGGDLAARMLTLYDPPVFFSGCSQAVFGGNLVRNYDFDPALFEGVICLTELTGRRVLGMSDCLWGLLDGVNDAGLAVSLAFGGRQVVRPGFSITLVVRYLLELCETTAEAVEVLARLPLQASHNLTIVDRSGTAITTCIAPDRPLFARETAVATNHQRGVEWPEHARAVATVEREERMLDLLAEPALEEAEFVAAFLDPPLYNTAFDAALGTLYTAVYRPLDGSVEYRWPGTSWRQSLAAFEEGSRLLRLTRPRSSSRA